MEQSILDIYRFEVVKYSSGYVGRCVRKQDGMKLDLTRPFCLLTNAINELKAQKEKMQKALNFKEEVVYTLEE